MPTTSEAMAVASWAIDPLISSALVSESDHELSKYLFRILIFLLIFAKIL
jgi:hypothetical protein